MTTLKDKVIFITGASRGIGHAIALRAAKDGAKIVIAAKTTEEHPKLPGTIYTAAKTIREAGGEALALKVDIRDEEEIEAAVAETVKKFGGIDILINNASAIELAGTLKTSMKRFDLMVGVNVRGTYATSQACIPHLLKAKNPHILMLSPPLNMDAKWFENHCAYTISKYGMSMCVLGMAKEFKEAGLAVNALWPKTTIATSAVNMLGGEALMQSSRKPSIVADAAYWILTQPSQECTGNFFTDEEVLAKTGVTDLTSYAIAPNKPLVPDFFID
jgi:Dehydrogenases with different specificities (related to short-chain alcohol dehydrogenases)